MLSNLLINEDITTAALPIQPNSSGDDSALLVIPLLTLAEERKDRKNDGALISRCEIPALYILPHPKTSPTPFHLRTESKSHLHQIHPYSPSIFDPQTSLSHPTSLSQITNPLPAPYRTLSHSSTPHHQPQANHQSVILRLPYNLTYFQSPIPSNTLKPPLPFTTWEPLLFKASVSVKNSSVALQYNTSPYIHNSDFTASIDIISCPSPIRKTSLFFSLPPSS